jgi:hypothetical protein
MSGPLPAERARRAAAREWRDVDRCDHLLAQHLAEAVQRFGAAALGVVDLPPLTGGHVEPAQLGAVATLLWAKEVDDAGLLDFVDALADGAMRGTLLLPLQRAGDRLGEWWRDRVHRFTADERRALYERVFGDPHAAGTTAAGIEDLVSVLVEIGTVPEDTARAGARLSTVAQDLAERLSDTSAGITAWAARDIVSQIRGALRLLSDPEIAGALGGFGSPWTLIRMQSPVVLGHPIDPTPHLDRARAGLAILSWLAGVSASLEGGGRTLVQPGDPVVQAAETWRAAEPA